MDIHKQKILLLEAAHPHRQGQVFLPGGSLNFAARLLANEAKVTFVDLTLDELPAQFEQFDCMMISCFAKPYLKNAAQVACQIRLTGYSKPIIVGGQGVEKLPKGLFERLMPEGVQMWQARGLQPLRESVGLGPALKLLSRKRVFDYIDREFGFYISDGCAYNCSFCDAHCAQAERYRSGMHLKREFEDICDRLSAWGRTEVSVYLSNLDAFQNEEFLRARMRQMYGIASRRGITIHARCLSTASSFVRGCERDPELLPKLKKYGMEIIAFGADGADPRVWQRENKAHNSIEKLEKAYELCREVGITAEALMVIGFHEDDITALGYALGYSLKWAAQGVVIRPYLGKPTASSLTQEQVDAIVRIPQLMLNLDYAMCGSKFTHPRAWQRCAANSVYLGLIAVLTPVKRNTTFPLMPRSKNRLVDWIAKHINRLMPADR